MVLVISRKIPIEVLLEIPLSVKKGKHKVSCDMNVLQLTEMVIDLIGQYYEEDFIRQALFDDNNWKSVNKSMDKYRYRYLSFGISNMAMKTGIMDVDGYLRFAARKYKEKVEDVAAFLEEGSDVLILLAILLNGSKRSNKEMNISVRNNTIKFMARTSPATHTYDRILSVACNKDSLISENLEQMRILCSENPDIINVYGAVEEDVLVNTLIRLFTADRVKLITREEYK